MNCDVIEVLGPVKNAYESLSYGFSKRYPNWIIEVFIVCAGVETRRCFWRDPKLWLRHRSIIKLSNKLFGDPIGSSGPSEQLGKKSRPILRVFQFWTNVPLSVRIDAFNTYFVHVCNILCYIWHAFDQSVQNYSLWSLQSMKYWGLLWFQNL